MKRTLVILAFLTALSGAAAADTPLTLGFTVAPTATQQGPIIPTGYTFKFQLTQEFVDSMVGNTALFTFGDPDVANADQGANLVTLELKDGKYHMVAGTNAKTDEHNAVGGRTELPLIQCISSSPKTETSPTAKFLACRCPWAASIR